MFRKIVTEFIYSPTLAGNLGVHLKHLRNERSKRQIGLIFVTLAVMVQLFATLFPPESANANNTSTFIDGGIGSIEEYLTYYDQNTGAIKDLSASLGIHRSDIESLSLQSTPSTNSGYLWSTRSSREKESTAYSFLLSNSTPAIAYSRPTDSRETAQTSYAGVSALTGDWFAILKETGSLVTQKSALDYCIQPYTSSEESVTTTSWITGASCAESIGTSLSVRTISQGPSTSSFIANPSDRIAYTVSLTNKGDVDLKATPVINLEDLLEYSRILDNGGGVYSYDTRLLSWPEVNIEAGKSAERTFMMQILPTIPSMARGQNTPASYDCSISASFGDSLSIPVNCPPVKRVESLTSSLPETPIRINVTFAALLLITTIYFYLRSRQLTTELYMVRYIHLGGV